MKFKVSKSRFGKNRSKVDKVKDFVEEQGLMPKMTAQEFMGIVFGWTVIAALLGIPLYIAYIIFRIFLFG